ncbi:UNVERIFIED_CONTAM: 40S ribosomal protein S3-1 [Sesamum angustifolium]|uniref:40S ribosomal protein S3-1 n=1 Tax=Sesamum angustifolium TaxID=2727405 RepID=A0AAW2MUI8_9LAMI
MATQMSKKRKFVADGVFFAELNELFTRELAEDGYSGVEVRVTPVRTEVIIRATHIRTFLVIVDAIAFNFLLIYENVSFSYMFMLGDFHLGEKGRRIRELTSVVQKRFKFPENSVELYAEKVNNRGLCAIAQAESLRYKLLGGLAACYGVLRFVMESEPRDVIISGKLRAQRAKSMKFKDGYMISSGQPVKEYIDSAVRHVLLRQGVLGIKVKIMLDWDPKGKAGPTTPLPDLVTIHPPKEEVIRPTMLPAEVEGADEGYKPAPTCARLECPPYKVVHSQKEFEIRSYEEGLWLSGPNITAPTYTDGAFKGFRILFAYYKGNNTQHVTINMTAPVLVDIQNSTYTVYFYVPKKYQTGVTLPTPLTDEIKKVNLPKFKYAAVRRFGGFISELSIGLETATLKKSLQGTPYQRAATGPVTVAGYNSPFELFNRVNEIWLGFN